MIFFVESRKITNLMYLMGALVGIILSAMIYFYIVPQNPTNWIWKIIFVIFTIIGISSLAYWLRWLFRKRIVLSVDHEGIFIETQAFKSHPKRFLFNDIKSIQCLDRVMDCGEGPVGIRILQFVFFVFRKNSREVYNSPEIFWNEASVEIRGDFISSPVDEIKKWIDQIRENPNKFSSNNMTFKEFVACYGESVVRES